MTIQIFTTRSRSEIAAGWRIMFDEGWNPSLFDFDWMIHAANANVFVAREGGADSGELLHFSALKRLFQPPPSSAF